MTIHTWCRTCGLWGTIAEIIDHWRRVSSHYDVTIQPRAL